MVNMWWSSLPINRNTMNMDIKNPIMNNWLDLDTGFLMELTDRNSEHMRLAITVTAELDPELEFFVEHQEDLGFLYIGNEHRPRDMP